MLADKLDGRLNYPPRESEVSFALKNWDQQQLSDKGTDAYVAAVRNDFQRLPGGTAGPIIRRLR